MILARPDLPGWNDLPFWDGAFAQVQAALAAEDRDILPPAPHIFAALARTRPQDVRVVILGQDPYPTPGDAHGFAFSAEADINTPRSLRNIFREMRDDIGAAPPSNDLRFWADRGVLLLNTALTVPAGAAGDHLEIGWRDLTRDVLMRLSTEPRAFVLWGKKAQHTGQAIAGDHHLIIQSPHPSPFSARYGFFGSRPFSRINAWLGARAKPPIDWATP